MTSEHGVKYVIDWALVSRWGAASNIVIALFAGAVWFVYWKQLVTMRTALAETRASNEIAGRALELGRRAWVVIHGAPSFSAGGWIFDDVTIENVADMPAVILRCGTGSTEGEAGKSVPSNLQYINSGAVLARSGKARLAFPNVGMPYFNRENPPESFAALERTAIFCVVEYTDCFEKTWRTTIWWKERQRGPDGKWQLGPRRTKLT